MKNTIDNLTILTNKPNPSISNGVWDNKRNAIKKHTVLLLNRHLVDTWSDEWNEDTIAERGEWLAEQASDIWLAPDSPRWS